MPCIIDQHDPKSKSKDSTWKSLCGKTLWFRNKPYSSPEDAVKFEGAICVKCRKIAKLPAPESKKKAAIDEQPFVVYRVAGGEVKALIATKETEMSFRTSNELLRKKEVAAGGILNLVGGAAKRIHTVRDKDTAYRLAKEQVGEVREFARKLLDKCDEALSELDQ